MFSVYQLAINGYSAAVDTMRSLTPTEIATRPIHELFPSSVGGRLAGRGAVDPESDRVYVALERINEGVVEVNIIAVGHDAGAGEVRGSPSVERKHT